MNWVMVRVVQGDWLKYCGKNLGQVVLAQYGGKVMWTEKCEKKLWILVILRRNNGKDLVIY